MALFLVKTFLMSFTNPLVYGVPCFLALILLELSYSKHHKEKKDLYKWKDLVASLTMGIGSTIIAPNEDVAVNVTVDLQEDDCSSLPMKMVEHIVNKSTVKKSEVITHQNAKGVGIFSDSRMYSAMIQSELKGHNVNIRHFNHPKTF